MSMKAAAQPALRVRCWGTRGSLPSPGPATVRFGGNTSCVELQGAAGERLIFDAGSGIRPLGESLAARGRDGDTDLFLTHFHWDHIQGLPFYGPIYDPRAAVRIHGPRQGTADVQSLVAGQMGPIYFPVPFDALEARLEFHHVNGDTYERGSLTVSSHRVRHPNHTYGYRVDAGGAAIAYVPDNELVGGSYDMAPGWYDSLRRFIGGVDILFHDAMFTDAEYPSFEGWGHSSVTQAVQLAEDAGVRHLCLFHHSPGRSDAELQRMLEYSRDDIARRGSALQLSIATEGEELMIEESK
ncbi:MAG TPA: MBL fold metallo-hydrolase [Longimicrobiales bacterium]|nr:MBL fold metallo-hydrolase [Longimicrobiales bacterium]